MTLLLLPRCVRPRPLQLGGKAGGGRRAVKGGPFRGPGKRVSGRKISTAASEPSAARRSAPKAGSGLQAETPQFSAYLPARLWSPPQTPQELLTLPEYSPRGGDVLGADQLCPAVAKGGKLLPIL